ncbi:hypothetical protein T09_8098 [Trichinella sp. T9]|nr:hypothetical protein T09_8098 [Trichinella sp. T9]
MNKKKKNKKNIYICIFSIKEDTETVTNNLINWWYKLVEQIENKLWDRFKYSIEQEEEKELFIVRLEIHSDQQCSLINVVVVMWLLFEEEGWGDWLIAFSWSIVVENLLSTMITLYSLIKMIAAGTFYSMKNVNCLIDMYAYFVAHC